MNTIKSVFFLLAFCILPTAALKAQVAYGIKPYETGKMGEFTAWTKVDVVFDDNSTATIEYRIAIIKRKGIACHYTVEVKNTSSIKLDIKVKSSYYDKFVKGQFGDEFKNTVKPGKVAEAYVIAQGCKKEKGVEKDDYGHCMACDFGVSIFVSK
jgi:hypothetical protein